MKQIPGTKFVGVLPGKEPPRYATLPDGSLVVAQADAPPLIIKDGVKYLNDFACFGSAAIIIGEDGKARYVSPEELANLTENPEAHSPKTAK